MGAFIHPNQFPAFQQTVQAEDISDGLQAALRFLEGIDYEDDALRRKRRHRAVRASSATASCMPVARVKSR